MTLEHIGGVPTVPQAPDNSPGVKEYRAEAVKLYHNLIKWDALARDKGMVSPFYQNMIGLGNEGDVKRTSYLVLTDPIMHVPESDQVGGNHFGLVGNGDMLLFWSVPILHLSETKYTYQGKHAYDLWQFYNINPKSEAALRITLFVANDIQQCLTQAVERIQSYRPLIPQVPSVQVMKV